MFEVIAAKSELVDVGADRTIPGLFEEGSGMRRFITDRDLDFRAGYTKVGAGQHMSTFFWYDEFWVVLEGGGKVTATDRPTGSLIERDLLAHDLVFIPAGTHIAMDVPAGDTPILFFYIAIPASNKHAHWLGSMTPEDIADIQRRNEHTPESFAAEAKRGAPLPS